MLEITERDIQMFDLIAKYGAIYVSDLKDNIYSGYKYYVRRVKKLLDENYVLRTNKILYIGFKGKEYYEENKTEYKTVRRTEKFRRKAADLCNISIYLNNFTVLPTKDMDRFTKNFVYKYIGIAINEIGKEYLIYKIKKVNIRENETEEKKKAILHGKSIEITNIKNELGEIVDLRSHPLSAEDIPQQTSAIIFIEDKYCMDLYKRSGQTVDLKEQILIPFTESGRLLVNKYVGQSKGSNENIYKLLLEKGLKPYMPKVNVTADFMVNDTYTANLTTSDYSIESKLNAYILSIGNNMNKISIICTESQRKKYQAEYNGCNIVTID